MKSIKQYFYVHYFNKVISYANKKTKLPTTQQLGCFRVALFLTCSYLLGSQLLCNLIHRFEFMRIGFIALHFNMTDAYLELNRTSTMELLCEKKLHRRCSIDGVLNTFLPSLQYASSFFIYIHIISSKASIINKNCFEILS